MIDRLRDETRRRREAAVAASAVQQVAPTAGSDSVTAEQGDTLALPFMCCSHRCATPGTDRTRQRSCRSTSRIAHCGTGRRLWRASRSSPTRSREDLSDRIGCRRRSPPSTMGRRGPRKPTGRRSHVVQPPRAHVRQLDGDAQSCDCRGDGARCAGRLRATEGARRHYQLDAVRGHLLEMAGDRKSAIRHYRGAADRTTSTPERNYLNTNGGRLAAAREWPHADRACRRLPGVFQWEPLDVRGASWRPSREGGDVLEALWKEGRSGS